MAIAIRNRRHGTYKRKERKTNAGKASCFETKAASRGRLVQRERDVQFRQRDISGRPTTGSRSRVILIAPRIHPVRLWRNWHTRRA
jgi:hypothetical protein